MRRLSLHASRAPCACPSPHSLLSHPPDPAAPPRPCPSPHTELAAYTAEHPVYRHINMRVQVCCPLRPQLIALHMPTTTVAGMLAGH